MQAFKHFVDFVWPLQKTICTCLAHLGVQGATAVRGDRSVGHGSHGWQHHLAPAAHW